MRRLYHNPRCRKSREARALLEKEAQAFDIREYLIDTPTEEELEVLQTKLGLEPLSWMRTGESLFRELGLSKKDVRTDQEWIAIMAKYPKLIERPILETDDRAIVGRPPENILKI